LHPSSRSVVVGAAPWICVGGFPPSSLRAVAVRFEGYGRVRDRAGGRCKEAGGEFLALKYATPLQAVKALAQDGTRVGDEGGGVLRVEKVTEGRVDYLRRAKGTETAPKNYGLEVDFSNTPTPKKAKNEDGHLRHRLNGHTSEDSEDLLIPRKKQISCWERIMKIMFDW